MKWSARCLSHGCYLQTAQLFPDLCAAEILAHAHEQRWVNDDSPHVVEVKESGLVQSSVERQTGKGLEGERHA